MSNSESNFNATFRTAMANRGVEIFRVESHATCPGIPDNHYIMPIPKIIRPPSGWIEMKDSHRVPAAMRYRPAQIPWLLHYTRQGGLCFTILHVEQPEEGLLLVPGGSSLKVSMSLEGWPVWSLTGNHRLETWDRVKTALMGLAP